MIRALLTAIILLAAPVAAEEITNEACLACHGTEGFAAPSGKPLAINADAFGTSVHAPLSCTTCHSDIEAIPHADTLKRVGIERCATCHEDAVGAYRKSIHGVASAKGVTEAASCPDCHGNLHTTTPRSEATSAVHWSKIAATCARCHAQVALTKKFGIPVAKPVDAYLKSAHARAVAAGKHGAECSDCHGAHDISPSSDPGSHISRSRVPETCGACHTEILAQYRDSVHGEALAHGNGEAPVCTDCHGEHRILGAGERASPVFAANIPGETCGRCHGNERLAEKYGIAVGPVAAFKDSFHGLALRAGKATVANCSSCHGVHDIRRSSDPRSHVAPANLAGTCGKCHPGAGARFQLGPVHGVVASLGKQIVGWVRAIYLWLIVGTIGGMIAHNLLDLARKARHHPPLPPPIPPGTRPRMTRALRWEHRSVMISFPILVYTGFALTYPDAWWSKPLLQWEAQLGLRGLMHRTAAVVMTIGVVAHLMHIVVSRDLRQCLRGMLPGFRDVRIAIGTIAYYLHWRAQPPLSGQFNYAEKAEYWAFMWGTAVMTLTGLLLWFENTTLHFLPAWVPDVATALHFYEAILATLAIFVWHFYWVIFDPEVYPMDWTWWTGDAPASRVHERREEDEGE